MTKIHFGFDGINLCGESGTSSGESGYWISMPIKPVNCGICRAKLDLASEEGRLINTTGKEPGIWNGTEQDNWAVEGWDKAILAHYDWVEAFVYAKGALPVAGLEPGAGPLDYERQNVVKIIATSEGENDGPSWLGIFLMSDGRYVYLEAGCDYTGWDCQAGGTAWWALDMITLWDRALNDEARSRLAKAEPK